MAGEIGEGSVGWDRWDLFFLKKNKVGTFCDSHCGMFADLGRCYPCQKVQPKPLCFQGLGLFWKVARQKALSASLIRWPGS